jgi:hypothetical protein
VCHGKIRDSSGSGRRVSFFPKMPYKLKKVGREDVDERVKKFEGKCEGRDTVCDGFDPSQSIRRFLSVVRTRGVGGCLLRPPPP